MSIHFGSPSAPAPLTFGLFFKLYGDGRKSPESIERLLRLAQTQPQTCRLVLLGKGWDEVTRRFPGVAAFVHEGFDTLLYERCLAQCDWVLYFGRDEGAMSIVDAAALGIPVLATTAGFHSDIALPRGSQLFDDGAQVVDAVERLCTSARPRREPDPPAALFASPPPAVVRAAWWRYAAVPFCANPSLQRKRNARDAAAWLWRHLRASPAPTPAPTAPPAAMTAIEPQSPAWHERRGLDLAAAGQHKLALLDLERACELAPQEPRLHQHLALSQLHAGERDAARRTFERAQSLDGDDVGFRCRFGIALAQEGRHDEARTLFDSVLQSALQGLRAP